jgi:hypothetical protein
MVVASGAFEECLRLLRGEPISAPPFEATPFTRVMPLASSAASRPLSAASTANFRTAVIRTLMETAPSRTVDRNIGQLQRHRNPPAVPNLRRTTTGFLGAGQFVWILALDARTTAY